MKTRRSVAFEDASEGESDAIFWSDSESAFSFPAANGDWDGRMGEDDGDGGSGGGGHGAGPRRLTATRFTGSLPFTWNNHFCKGTEIHLAIINKDIKRAQALHKANPVCIWDIFVHDYVTNIGLQFLEEKSKSKLGGSLRKKQEEEARGRAFFRRAGEILSPRGLQELTMTSSSAKAPFRACSAARYASRFIA